MADQTEHPEGEGWVPLGTHMDSPVRLEFCDHDSTGVPEHERVVSDRDAERQRIRYDLLSIIGYTCETQAPNSKPTGEYITGRWMSPRLDALVDYVARARAEGARDALNAAAEWLTSTGFPVDYSMGVHTMPEPFWQAVVDVIHADKTGGWHGNTLDREETEDWLTDETGRTHHASGAPTTQA